MKNSIFIFILGFAFSIFSCSSTNGPTGKDGQDETKETENADGYKKVSLKSEITSVQPMTGIVLWTTSGKRTSDAISLEYSYLLYSDVVKQKGIYDWSKFDNLLNEVAKRGHQAVVRFRYVYVGDKESAVPQYIRDLSDYEETIGMSEGRETCFPDWRHAELQRFHLEFYQKFAEKYDNDPRLAFLQTGFGLWAEYHIYDGPMIAGRTFPSKEFQQTFFQEMSKNFKNTPWNISIDASDNKYGPFVMNPTLKDLKFGLFDDSFMHKSHASYNTSCWNFFDRNRYKHSPAGGEFSYYTTDDQKHVLDYPDGIHGRNFESEAEKFHITYMIGNDQTKYQTIERIKQASMACGYRYKITGFGVKENTSRVKVKNTGVAPIYYNAYITVNGVRCKDSLIDLQPGEEKLYEISSGGETPVLTIECDRLVEGQKIEFEADI
ncbi:DUF4832 domain-containing protein [Paludibacter sp. 221]|uniref:DUF4832 domain-containing protein n=1 Tax=Paludibacter sp. 221 TaxID=2302939 RepID=UPI001944D573|nr:DUF4832 domain-containing protein [Paludibacter sp. 221]